MQQKNGPRSLPCRPPTYTKILKEHEDPGAKSHR